MTSANADPTSEPDEHLVRALLHDLDAGFAQLFQAYRHVVLAMALRICRRPVDAEDLAAESFLHAYRALAGYRRNRIMALRPRSWLLTILLNLWRNHERTVARRAECDPLEATWDRVDVTDLEQTITGRETGRELAALLTELPAAQRAAVILRHMVDLPVAEIAGLLGRPEGTIKSDISRGLRRLRALYPTLAGQHRARTEPRTLARVLPCPVAARSPDRDPLPP